MTVGVVNRLRFGDNKRFVENRVLIKILNLHIFDHVFRYKASATSQQKSSIGVSTFLNF